MSDNVLKPFESEVSKKLQEQLIIKVKQGNILLKQGEGLVKLGLADPETIEQIRGQLKAAEDLLATAKPPA